MSDETTLTRRQLREREQAALAARIAAIEPGTTPSRATAQPVDGSAASTAEPRMTAPDASTTVSTIPGAPTAAAAPAEPRRLVLRDPATASARATAPRVQRAPAASTAPSPARVRRSGRRIVRGVLSAGILVVAGAFVLGVSVPAAAFLERPTEQDVTAAESLDSQSLQTVYENDDLITRSEFGARSAVENEAAQKYAHSGIWTPTTGSVRWPFPYTVGISSWYGPRRTTIPGVSSFHKGIDFTPGEGAPTYAIADGVVELSSVSPYGLGNEVIIDHVIDGVKVQSVYGHLEMNSSPLRVGQHVKVGDMVGKTGSTGTVTGANMHLEIHVNGTPVEPFSWLKKNARND